MNRHFLASLLVLALSGCVTPVVAPLPVPITGAYNSAIPFAKIIRGKLPAARVYEDDKVLAFMDIAPVEFGHVLVVSKTSQARGT